MDKTHASQQLLLVDNHDNFLGYKDRKTCHTGEGMHHRAFVVCLLNNKDQILLQKRKHMLWDGFWDVTAISHPLHLDSHDETYEEAGLRSLKTEMGITNVSIKKVGAFNYFAKFGDYCENEYCAVLVGAYNGEVHPDSDLVHEYKWMDTNTFIKDCKKNPDVYAPWTILTAELLDRPSSEDSG